MKQTTRSVLLLLLLGLLCCAFAQDNPRSLWLEAETDSFQTIQRQAAEYFSGRDRGRGSGYKQWKRWEYKMQRRLLPDGRITNYTARNWQAFQDYLREKGGYPALITNGNWSSLGPESFSTGNSGYNGGMGRCNVLAFHPTNSNIVYAGMPAGGLWTTTNHGSTWESLTDGMPVLGVSGIAVDYNDPDIIYILTGDGDGGDTQTVGVLKTTDGGVTWYSTGLSHDVDESVKGYKLAMHPTNSSVLFACMTDGLHKTDDGGITWTEVQSGSFRDLEFKPGTPATMYAVTTSSYYRSTDSGNTWTLITTGLPTGETRSALGVTPANPSYVYYLAGPGGTGGAGTFMGLYRSVDSGLIFTTQTTTPNIIASDLQGDDNAAGQSWYDLAIAVDPGDPEEVITGGVNIWRDEAGGGTAFTIITHWNENTVADNGLQYTHADIHDLIFQDGDNLWAATDGGVFLSTDDGITWTDKSPGLAITQFYRIAGTESDPDLIIGGTQDNGSNKWTGALNMEHIFGGDGMDCMIDHSNPDVLYISTQNGGLRKSSDGGDNSSDIQPSGSTGAWVTPYVMNPQDSDNIYGGYDDVYKSTDGGTTWTNMGSDGRGAIAMGTSNPNRIYAANGATIQVSSDAAVTWTDVSAGLPGLTITYIAVNPDNSPEVFVTLGTFTDGEKVYRSRDTGVTWTNITGSLPNCIVNCIAYEDTDGSPNDAVYIGTDVGIFYRDADLGDWIPFMNGLPSVPVFDLEINHSNGLIRAGTHGRAIWESSLYSSCPSGLTLTEAGDPGNPNYTGYQYYQASATITSSRVITGGEGTDVTYRAGEMVLLVDGFHARSGNKFHANIGGCGGGVPVSGAQPVSGFFNGTLPELTALTGEFAPGNPEQTNLASLPKRHDLAQNYPNPFNPETTIPYALPSGGHVIIRVFNIVGQEVITLADEWQDAGYRSIDWNGRNSAGSPVASGIYIYHMTAGEFVKTRRMILVR